jgi:phosphoribosyl-ATP pyrophosphohydrolase
LSSTEFRRLIREKFVEESKEVVVAKKEELVNELCDVMQLVISIAEYEDIKLSEGGNI